MSRKSRRDLQEGEQSLDAGRALVFPAHRAYPAPLYAILLTWMYLTEKKNTSDQFRNATLNPTSFVPGNSAWTFQISIHMHVCFHISSQSPYKPFQHLLGHTALLAARSLSSTGSFLGSAPEPVPLTELSQEEATHTTSRGGFPPGTLSHLLL